MFDFAKSIESITKALPFGIGGAQKKKEQGQDAPSTEPQATSQESSAGEIEIGVVQDSSLDTAQVDDLKKQLALNNERIAELETRIYKAERIADNVKKENELLKGRMDQNDARILDMLSVYEVVSNQINPFVGSSKVISSTMEQLHEEVSSLKSQVSTIGSDLKILARGRVDINRLVRTSVTDSDAKRRVDLTKLIRSAVQTKKTVRTKKGDEIEYGP
jgi:archaeal flagellar protein FlaC